MKILRVQDKDGRGPYRPGFSHRWIDPENDGSTQPQGLTQISEGLKRAPKGSAIGFGFRSLEQLERWFSQSELLKLYLLGYQIVELDADGILSESKEQIFFWRREPLNVGATLWDPVGL